MILDVNMPVTDYTVTEDEKTVTIRGVVMRSKIYDYPGEEFERVYRPPEAIAEIPNRVKWVPVTLAHTDSIYPGILDEGQQIGDFYPLDGGSGRLVGKFVLQKDLTPTDILEALRNSKPIPVSTGFEALTGKSGKTLAGESYDASHDRIRLGHVAVLTKHLIEAGATARCKVEEGCGIGITDAVQNGSEPSPSSVEPIKGEGPNSLSGSMTEEKKTEPTEEKVEDSQPSAPVKGKDYEAELKGVLDTLRADILNQKCNLIKEEDIQQITDSRALLLIRSLIAKKTVTDSAQLPVGEPPTTPKTFEDYRKEQVKKMIEAQREKNKKIWGEMYG